MLCEVLSVASSGMRLLASPMEPSTRMSPVAGGPSAPPTAGPSSLSAPAQATVSSSPRVAARALEKGPFMERDSIAKARLFQRNWRFRDD